MMHDYHPGLEDYDAEHVWHDGCTECEDRGKRLAFYSLDLENSRKMVERARLWRNGGTPNISNCERQLIQTIGWALAYV